jgi:thiamine transport system ATP-binding protein
VSAHLQVEGATVRFGPHLAVDGVDLDVAPGEVLAVLGPSGSGKSTLLRAIAGLQPLAAGSVRLDGRDVTTVPPHRRGVGLMFQDHALFPHRDVAGNVGFGLRMQGRSAGDVARRVAELLALVDLDGYEGRSIQTLSGGEQQRVALARALAPEPGVLLLDEPLGALDRSLRDRLVVELRALFTRLELTVVAVTHDQSEAFSLADRVAVLDRGRLLQVGPPAEVWAAPAGRRVAELLGIRNIVEVDVRDGCATTPWGSVALDAPDGAVWVVVRPSLVRLAPGGGVAGTVVACAFAGERTVVTVAPEDGPAIEASVATAHAPAPGSRVAVHLDPGAAVPVGPTRPLTDG